MSIYGPEYHKIQSVYLRDPANKNKTFLDGQWARPEFGYLADAEWVFTEKVDGTCVRVTLDPALGSVQFGGKTDTSQLPIGLVSWLRDKFPVVPDGIKGKITLYGEGYGEGIQKYGAMYGGAQRFVLFDAMAGDTWLRRETLEEIAEACAVEAVPVIGSGTLYDAIERTKRMFNSKWGPFSAEGIVARPAVELLDRRGQRIITKVKCRDFA